MQGIEAGGVLVHCMGGRSRSAAFICAYLMSSHGLSYEESVARLKMHRPVVNINRGFEKQLRAYSMTNFDVYAAHQVLLRQRIRSLHLRRAEHMLGECCVLHPSASICRRFAASDTTIVVFRSEDLVV